MSEKLIGHGNRKAVPVVPAKVKVAIAVLLEQPKEDLAAAALAAGITTYRLREALKKSYVRQYLYHEKQALLEAVSAGNPLALKQVRDTSDNGMAVVAAAKAIEMMKQEGQEITGGPLRQLPGVTIIIEAANGRAEQVIGPRMPLIEARPVPEFEPATIEE
jgi:hypothetical protein